jgi:hypothetical protein
VVVDSGFRNIVRKGEFIELPNRRTLVHRDADGCLFEVAPFGGSARRVGCLPSAVCRRVATLYQGVRAFRRRGLRKRYFGECPLSLMAAYDSGRVIAVAGPAGGVSVIYEIGVWTRTVRELRVGPAAERNDGGIFRAMSFRHGTLFGAGDRTVWSVTVSD